MKLFSRIAAALTGLAVLGTSASSAMATQTNFDEGSIRAHQVLWDQIEAVGVDVQVNHSHCDTDPAMMGFYAGEARLLVV